MVSSPALSRRASLSVLHRHKGDLRHMSAHDLPEHEDVASHLVTNNSQLSLNDRAL